MAGIIALEDGYVEAMTSERGEGCASSRAHADLRRLAAEVASARGTASYVGLRTQLAGAIDAHYFDVRRLVAASRRSSPGDMRSVDQLAAAFMAVQISDDPDRALSYIDAHSEECPDRA